MKDKEPSLITLVIVKQMLPALLVGSDDWRNLMTEMDPRYQCPSSKYYTTKSIAAKYTQCKEVIMRELSKPTSISCMTDGWSSITTDPYMSLAVHYLTPSWTLRTYCLRTIYMPQSHTGINIAHMLRTILAEFNLHISDITTFTTDNGSNMKVAIRELKVIRIPCFGRILYNAINISVKSLDEITTMLKECRALVSTLNHSHR